MMFSISFSRAKVSDVNVGMRALMLFGAAVYPLFMFAQAAIPAAYPSGTRVNYLRTWELYAPEQNSLNVPNRVHRDISQTTEYFDGLGRHIQSVAKAASPLLKDNVTTQLYDPIGREIYSYLPFSSNAATSGDITNDGEFKMDAFQQQAAFSAAQYPGETYFYTKRSFELSPLNRVLNTYEPGNSWVGADKGSSVRGLINTATDNIQIWTVTTASASLPVKAGVYAQGKLFKTVTTDPNGKLVIEFKNEEGKLILKKTQLDAAVDDGAYAGWISFYNIYDDFGNLRFVLSPAATLQLSANNWVLTQAIVDGLCFRYEYDQLNRLIVQKSPGVGEIWTVYDALDRVVMEQDGNARLQQWKYITYDNLNRVTSTGFLIDNHDRSYHSALAQVSVSYPNLASYTYTVLTNTFYDSYSWLGSYSTVLTATMNTSFSGNFLAPSNSYPYPQAITQSAQVFGKPTGSRSLIVGTSQYLYAIIFYDNSGHTIQTQATNILGGNDINTTQYDFSGKPLRQLVSAGPTGQAHTVLTKFQYDEAGRTQSIVKNYDNLGDQQIAAYTYDELGKMKSAALGSPVLETLNYEYNIRGWLTGINRSYLSNPANTASWFGLELAYDKTSSSSYHATYTASQMTGNIAGMMWRSKGDGEFRKYDLNYDPTKRLLKAKFNQLFGTTWTTTDPSNAHANIDFTETVGDGSNVNTAYDPNGNIKKLQHNGIKSPGNSPLIDNLSYTTPANSNQLQNTIDDVNDPTTLVGDFRSSTTYMSQLGTKTTSAIDYTYDANGNLLKDLNKDIGTSTTNGIVYNSLNLPMSIAFPAGSAISFAYSADGNKLQKTVVDRSVGGKKITTVITYCQGFVFQSRTTEPNDAQVPDYSNRLMYCSHEEGQVRYFEANGVVPARFVYDYFLKDHLKNVRMVLTNEVNQEIYPAATLEGTGVGTDPTNYEQKYFTINSGQIVSSSSLAGITTYANNNGNPPVNNNPNCSNTSVIKQTDNSAKIYLLNGTTNKIGLGITLKVMAGDKVDIFGKSYYTQLNTGGQAANTAILAIDLISQLLGTPMSPALGHGTAAQIGSNTIGTVSPLNTFIGAHDKIAAETTPRAYINYIILDEQFSYVSSGMSQVGPPNTIKSHFSDAGMQNIAVSKNGYIYIYCSNESPVNVYFDNLQPVLTHGPLLEETHYYPFGLTMNGISSKVLTRPEVITKYNGFDLQHKEFASGTGLDWYDYKHRYFDPQISRFCGQDHLATKYPYYSPYQFAGNQVPNAIDLDGQEPMSAAEDQTTVESGFDSWGRSVDIIFDPASITAGVSQNGYVSVMTQANVEGQYFWRTADKQNGIYSPTTARDENGNWTGEWVKYKSYEEKDAEIAAKSADMLSSVFTALIVAPALIEGAVGTAAATEGLAVDAALKSLQLYWRYAPTIYKFGIATAAVLDESGTIGHQEEYLAAKGIENINGYIIPPNNGFLISYPVTLETDMRLIRYGDYKPFSRFAGAAEDPWMSFSLFPNTNINISQTYKVLKPFEATGGPALPFFNQPGLGIQYHFDTPIEQLIHDGFLDPVKIH